MCDELALADTSPFPPLREVIARHGLWARKRLGQHFLLDSNLTDRIARTAGALSEINVIEIGPGPGGLTRSLLTAGARSVVAVETDERCVAAVRELEPLSDGRLSVLVADALKIDAAELVAPPRAIVANLPYNIATPLLIKWLQQAEAFESLTLMFQKEVADRLSARPGTKAYGRLSVMTQWRTEVRPAFTIPARAFTPAPKVESAVVHLTARRDPAPADWPAMEAVVAAAFGKRRKMLRQSLRTVGNAEALLAAAGLPPESRAEDIDVAGFARLARASRAGDHRVTDKKDARNR